MASSSILVSLAIALLVCSLRTAEGATKKKAATTITSTATSTKAKTTASPPTTTTTTLLDISTWVERQGAKYLFVTGQSLSFADAQDYCFNTHGAFLASITSPEANMLIADGVISASGVDFWLGGISKGGDAKGFQWLDDSRMSFLNFQSTPTPGPNDQCILFSAASNKWVSTDCTTTHNFVCKYFVPSNTPGLREYFIRADEVAWNYAPDGANMIKGLPFSEEENVFVGNDNDQIGSTYIKCLYRAYTDGSFQTRVPETQESIELGFVGPTIRAVIGEHIRVVFRNKCEFPVTMHPHGVSYSKDSEGAGYQDGYSDGSSDFAVDGSQQIYLWFAREQAAPRDPSVSTSQWMYHGHNDEIGENYAGLNGFLILTAKGKANPDATPNDVDKEAFSLFMVMNEQLSLYFDKNIETYAPARVGQDQGDWQESDLMHNINGYVYGNGPKVDLQAGKRTRWYTMGMGTEVDLHTPHWHGNLVVHGGMVDDVVSLLPATMIQADMTPDEPGVWLYHCHVNDHIFAGMITTYQVQPFQTP